MLSGDDMKNANDNDTWTSLAFHTQLVLNKLQNAAQLSGAEDARPAEQCSQKNEPEANRPEEYSDEQPRRALA
jgi:hypothetical protein